MKQALQESDSLWATFHIPSHHCIRQHNSISGWWAEKVGSLPGRRFHDSQPPKVMRFSANSMKSGLNFGTKQDNSCLRSISRVVDGNALYVWQRIMWPYGWDLGWCQRRLGKQQRSWLFSSFLAWLRKWWILRLDFTQTQQATKLWSTTSPLFRVFGRPPGGCPFHAW